MPRQRLPNSLHRICLAFVARNIQALCPENMPIAGVLPPSINEEILAVLQRSQPHNLGLLIHILGSVVRRVALPPGTPLAEVAALRVFRQLLQNQKHLVDLDLVLAPLHVDAFAALLSRLARLQRLILWVDDLTEPLVVAICLFCTRLRQLCLYKVGRGSYIRVVAANENAHLIELSVHLPLKILTNLPELRVFRISFLAFALLHLPATTRLKLTELVALEPSILECPWALLHITAVCPMLTKVYLSLTNDREITPLARLAFLNDLSLFTNGDANVGFMALIEPLLRIVGGNLRRLRLYISDLDINCITRFCPALRELRLEGLERLINYSRDETRSLVKLQKFRLSLHVMSSLHPNRPFEFLQDYGHLAVVFLKRCHLADSALQQLISSGTFSRLRELQLTEVHGVTMSGLRDLVMAENDLLVLFVIRCTHVTSVHIDELRRLVRSMNLGLGIHFSPLSDQWA